MNTMTAVYQCQACKAHDDLTKWVGEYEQRLCPDCVYKIGKHAERERTHWNVTKGVDELLMDELGTGSKNEYLLRAMTELLKGWE